MKNRPSKRGERIALVCLLFSFFQNYSHAEDKNGELAKVLLQSLKTKVNTSLATARSKPISTWDASKLTIQCLDDEFQFQEVQNDILLPWQQSWKTKKITGFTSLLSKNFNSQSFSSLAVKNTQVIDGITQNILKPAAAFSIAPANVSDFSRYLDQFKQISFMELTAEKYISLPANRSSDRKMKSAVIFVRYNLRGEGKTEKKLEERGMLKINVDKAGTNWKLSKLEILSSERLATNKIFFNNITKSSRVAELVPSHLRREAIRRGGYALAVEDYNNDNTVGMFVATVAETVLLKGSKNFVFTSANKGQLSKQTLVKSAAFADLTNSGKQDLVLVRFAPNESQTKNDRSDIQVYKNLNGDYTKRDKVISFNHNTAYAMPMAVADFNNDSFLDFYVGFPGSKDFTTLTKAEHKKGLTTEGIFYNQKNGTFTDDPFKSFEKIHSNDTTELSKIFAHSALATDFNQDGHVDLVVIDDRGNLSPLYINKGGGVLETASDKIGIGLKDYGMGVDVADLNGDGKLDFVMSSVNFNSSKRIKESCAANWSVQNTISAGTSGLRVFSANKNLTYTETTEANGLSWTGEGAGGVKVFDYNNDGFPDIYLANGLWTGSEKDNSQDIAPYFVAASALGILEDNLKSELRNNNFVYDRLIPNNDFKSLLFNSDSQSSIMDLLSFYRGDLSGKNPKAKASLSLAGNQPNRLFRNNGDNTYTEVGFMMSLDSLADGYMPATASLNRDGNLDLILRNADPGYNVNQHSPVEIFKNLGTFGNNSLTLKLKGSASNKDAIGTQVEGKIGNKIYVGQVLGNSGTIQSERIVHFGIGQNKKIDSLKVTWPSGKVQNFSDVSAGFHVIKESEMQISQN